MTQQSRKVYSIASESTKLIFILNLYINFGQDNYPYKSP